MRRSLWLGLALGLVLAGGAARADVWDLGADPDNSNGTDNELIHGTSQIHDLAPQGPVVDLDWYVVGQKRQSSYEVVIDSTGGDIGVNGNLLQLVDAAGASIQNAVSVTPGLDFSRSLRFMNTSASTVTNQFVRVGPANCGTACTASDVYHIRMMETTIAVPRFNNAGSQVTVLIMQNASENPMRAWVFFWSTSGTQLDNFTLVAAAKSVTVLNLTTHPALVGVSGHITIAHDAPYGQLNVKTVALEPSTGFSFDTPGVYRGF
jgi:hypothetical protein